MKEHKRKTEIYPMKMKSRLQLPVLLIFFFVTTFSLHAQEKENKYGVKVVSGFQEYLQEVAADSANILMSIKEHVPGVVLDIKYATKDNFVGEAVYKQPLSFARKPVVEALAKVEAELKKQGLGLKIWDAYRPYSVTCIFYEKTQDSVYTAAPWRGSRHNRGCAVDLTIIDLKSGKELMMPTPYDDFSDKAHPDYMKLPGEILHNRNLLATVMKKYGFSVYPSEWWHFDYQGWESFELMDISFEQLEGK
jgi:D-alanyl-D-alanine dipeptidase